MNLRTLLFMGTVALSACASETPPASDVTTPTPAPEAPSQTTPALTHTSPWEAAKTRGVGFRGIGTEPGWMVEVGMGETPALHAELDYGERKLDIAQVQSLSGILGYAGKTADGVEVKLHLQREDCSDGMSDNNYPVTARLSVDGKIYTGCGRFLQE